MLSRHWAPVTSSWTGGKAITFFVLAQVLVAQKVAAGVYKGVSTTELDELAAETAAALTSTHPDYAMVSCALGALLTPVPSPYPK